MKSLPEMSLDEISWKKKEGVFPQLKGSQLIGSPKRVPPMVENPQMTQSRMLVRALDGLAEILRRRRPGQDQAERLPTAAHGVHLKPLTTQDGLWV